MRHNLKRDCREKKKKDKEWRQRKSDKKIDKEMKERSGEEKIVDKVDT